MCILSCRNVHVANAEYGRSSPRGGKDRKMRGCYRRMTEFGQPLVRDEEFGFPFIGQPEQTILLQQVANPMGDQNSMVFTANSTFPPDEASAPAPAHRHVSRASTQATLTSHKR